MSTHAPTDTTASTHRPTTDTRPEATTTPSEASEVEPDTDTPDTDASWVARCQSQFDAGAHDRLGNLTDDENEYVRGSH